MKHLRIRALLPALLIQLTIALTISQQAIAQEVQTTATRPAQRVEAATVIASVKDEACEQSVAPVAATRPASIEEIGAGKKGAVSASQPLHFAVKDELKIAAPRSFAFDAKASLNSKSIASPLSPAADLSDHQQTGTAATTITPLTAGEKMSRAFKSAFISPRAYILPGVSAIITEVGEDDLPHKDTDDRVADGLSRFAINFGTRSTSTLLSSGVYASLFRQDPRNYRSDSKSIGARALFAASRVIVTRGDNGKTQPNYSRFAGQLSASALSNLWQQSTPGNDRIGADATFRRFGASFVGGAIFNVISEFLPDIKKIFGR